jgi:DNA excision repair protein ERCC-2
LSGGEGGARWPYGEWRRGQRELAGEVERAAREGLLLVVNAPTGFGKTAAVAYGLLEAGVERVLWVVRTVNEIDPVIRELKAMGARFTFLFSARRSCPLLRPGEGEGLSGEEFWANCRLARLRGACPFYANLRSVGQEEVWAYVRGHYSIHATRIAADLAKHLGVCPFFALRGLLDESRFVVATYPYLFRRDIFEGVMDPYTYEDFVVVVDEAHSLMGAHTLLEQRITLADIEAAIAEVRAHEPSATAAVEALQRLADSLGKARPGRDPIELAKEPLGEALEAAEMLADLAESIRERKMVQALAEGGSGVSVRSPLYRVALWLLEAREEWAFLFAQREGERIYYIATPVDPAVVAREPLERARAAILMSGTIPPGGFVEELLGVGRERRFLDVELEYGPLTPPGRVFTVVATDVTTRYTERSGRMYQRIAEYIAAAARILPGAKLVVYPSYDVMMAIVERLPVSLDVLVEGRATRLEEARSRVIENPDLVINAVAGGKLVEGVEFTDHEGRNLLHTVIVVGVPYPQPDAYTRRHLAELAKRLGSRKARYYAYDVSAAVKVRQAMGRARRSPRDGAAYILLDRRYIRKRLRELLRLRFDELVSSPRELEALAPRLREAALQGVGAPI